jgi:hydroxymethylglutaryl-CoA reductase (NADPH)
MRLAAAVGGVTATVIADRMQRAPVFEFDDARAARAFGRWVDERFAEIGDRAEATTRVGRLVEIEQYSVSRLAFLRFDFTTGDAAGQNMVGKATSAA